MSSKTPNNYVSLYLADNLLLAKTLVVFSRYAVEAINKQMKLEHGENSVDPSDPTSWKYFRHLTGEYHALDKPMMVVSLDTQETILFSKENLIRHTATAVEYRYGTRYYRLLANEFPDQIDLINGILTPCTMEQALSATDGDILAYPSYLVEENETTLIKELQDFIKVYLNRWHVSAFSLSDSFYPAMSWAMLMPHCYTKLLNLREARCKTDEVHSFHLREYLASHHRLDRFLPYMTREQALWVYKNIRYLERNPGKMKSFQSLLENLLDKQNIPLAEYSVRQLSAFTDDNRPVVQAKRRQISRASLADNTVYLGLDQLYAKEEQTAYGNARFMAVDRMGVSRKLMNSYSSVTQTKDLESAMVDLTNSVPDSLEEVMTRQLVAMTHQGLYNVLVRFQDPKTGVAYSLMSWDAVAYLFYLTFKSRKIEFTTLPGVVNSKFRLHPRPLVTELTQLIEPGMEWLRPVAEELVSSQPVLSNITSVSMFNDLTTQIYDECLKHWFLTSNTHDLYARGVAEKMTLKLFGVAVRDFSRGEEAEAWRVRNNLPEYDYTYDEANALIKEIFQRATGMVIDTTKQLRYIQANLLDMFAELSSYSIQIMREINDGEIIHTGMPQIRLGNVRERVEGSARVQTGLYVNDSRNKISEKIQVVSQLDETIKNVRTHYVDNVPVEATLSVVTNMGVSMDSVVRQKPLEYEAGVTVMRNGVPVTIVDPSPESMLTTEQIKNLKFL